MKENIQKFLEEHRKKTKAVTKPGFKITMKSGETSSLGKMIKTQEQADLFMKLLRSM